MHGDLIYIFTLSLLYYSKADPCLEARKLFVIPLYGPSNQIFSLLSSIAISAEFEPNVTTLFNPIYPHYLQYGRHMKENCSVKKFQNTVMVADDYINTTWNSVKYLKNIDPKSIIFCAPGIRSILDVENNFYAKRSFDSFASSYNFLNFTGYSQVYDAGAKVNNQSNLLNCVRDSLSAGYHVVAVSNSSYDICHGRLQYTAVNTTDRRSHSLHSNRSMRWPTERISIQSACPRYEYVMSLSPRIFSRSVASKNFTLGRAWEVWLRGAIAVHLRVKDQYAATSVARNASLHTVMGVSHHFCKQLKVRTLLDLKVVFIKRVRELSAAPKLFVMSNNNDVLRLFRSNTSAK